MRDLLLELAARGQFFVYDLDALKKHADDMMRQIAGTGIKLWYACKANPLGAIIETLKNSGFNCDVASEGELAQAIRLGISGDKTLITGPAKSEQLLRQALAHKLRVFVIESEAQLRLLQTIAPEYGYEPEVLLRVQLQWNSGISNILGGNDVTHFGVDIETAKKLIKEIKLPFLGFHVFQWGNVLSIEHLESIWQKTLEGCRTVTTDFKVLDVGGGIGIPYLGEEDLNWAEIVSRITNIQAKYSLEEFWLELGRYVIGPHGVYVTRVVDKKTIYGKQILVLESGVNHITKSALHNACYPAFLHRKSSHAPQKFSVYGPLCMASDFLGDHYLPADTAIHDVVILKQVGAYGFTQSMPFFLCHNLAGEAVVQNGTLQIIREPASAAMWLK